MRLKYKELPEKPKPPAWLESLLVNREPLMRPFADVPLPDIRKALGKEKDTRFASATEMLMAMAGEPVARPKIQGFDFGALSESPVVVYCSAPLISSQITQVQWIRELEK